MSRHIKSDNRNRHRNSGGRGSSSCNVGAQAKEALAKIDETCPTLQNFRMYSTELDKRHDRFERIVKLSRDITIESKRIIFLLHTIDRDSKRISVLNEAEKRLGTLVTQSWRSVAKELHNQDPYLYHKAFSPGMQEFMEAFIFFNYLKNENFVHWSDYQNKLKYKEGDDSKQIIPEIGDTDKKTNGVEMSMMLSPIDFILGLADVTGELMRKCINNLGEGDVEGCFKTCDFVRNLHSGFLTIGSFGNKEMSHKAFTLRQSLLKMEMVCYNIHVRGTEIPKHMLADVNTDKTFTEEDEGFFC